MTGHISKHNADSAITSAPITDRSIVDIEDKAEISNLEHKVIEHEDPNSPEAILDRYPLLRVMTEDEREVLNRRVRRRIDIRMLPTLTVCLMINYLDRSNVTNARVAGMQEDMNMNDVQWVSPSNCHVCRC